MVVIGGDTRESVCIRVEIECFQVKLRDSPLHLLISFIKLPPWCLLNFTSHWRHSSHHCACGVCDNSLVARVLVTWSVTVVPEYLGAVSPPQNHCGWPYSTGFLHYSLYNGVHEWPSSRRKKTRFKCSCYGCSNCLLRRSTGNIYCPSMDWGTVNLQK